MLITTTNKRRIQTLALTSFCLIFQTVPFAGLPLLLPLIRQKLGLTYIQAGSLASANLLVYALMQVPSGYLADRYSPRKLVVIGVVGLMGLSILLAFTQQYWQILGILFFWGFFSARNVYTLDVYLCPMVFSSSPYYRLHFTYSGNEPGYSRYQYPFSDDR